MSYTQRFIDSELPAAVEDLEIASKEIQAAIVGPGNIEDAVARMRAALERLTVQCRVVRRLQAYDGADRTMHLADVLERTAPPGVLLH